MRMRKWYLPCLAALGLVGLIYLAYVREGVSRLYLYAPYHSALGRFVESRGELPDSLTALEEHYNQTDGRRSDELPIEGEPRIMWHPRSGGSLALVEPIPWYYLDYYCICADPDGTISSGFVWRWNPPCVDQARD